MGKKKRKARSVSPASAGPSRNMRAKYSENALTSTPSRPVFRGDADPYSPSNANASITTLSGDMDFRLKFLCQADPTEADGLYKEAVQGLVNITLPPNILNQLCQDTIVTQMRELGAPQYKVDRVCELIRHEIVFKISWLLANEMDTAEKAELGLATVIAASSRLHANKFDYKVFDDIVKGFENLRNQFLLLQTDNLASGASIQMPVAEQCSRRQSAAMAGPASASARPYESSEPIRQELPHRPLANAKLESVEKKILPNEARRTNEGQEHLYESDQSWNECHGSKADIRQVSVKQEILTQASEQNIKKSPQAPPTWPNFAREFRHGSYNSDSDSRYGSVNEEAMADVLERTVENSETPALLTNSDEESGPESNDAKQANLRTMRTLMRSLTNSPTPCIDLLYGTAPLSPMDTKATVRKIIDEINIRFEDKSPILSRRNKRGKFIFFTVKQTSETLRNLLNTQLNPERARSNMERSLQPLICMNPHYFKELGTCSFLFPKMMQDITPVLDLLHPNCPECCYDNRIIIVDHIIFAVQAREIKTVPYEVIIDDSNFSPRMASGMRKILLSTFIPSREADSIRWSLESKLRMFVFRNRSRFPELEQSPLGREWMAVSGCKW